MKAVGIDVGKSALDVAVRGEAHVQCFANTKAGIGRLMRELAHWGETRIVTEAT